MDKEILRRIENIKNDQLHGSGWLAAYAVNTLTLCIAESPRKDIKSILKETEILANNIAAARKNMVYISNALYLFQAEVARLSKDRHEVPSFKKAVLVKGNRFLHTMEINSARAALKAARIICNGDTVMTCSYSSLMIGAFLTAKNNNIDFKVIACESMVQDISYGILLKENLDRYHIKHAIIKDTAIGKLVSKANKVMVGADAVLADGSIINGKPSKKLAEAAAGIEITCFSVCENAKFDYRKVINKSEMERGFDLIPPKLWTAIITESGKITGIDLGNHFTSLKIN